MDDQRPKTEQTKEPNAPKIGFEPTPNADPAKPLVTNPQPKGTDYSGNSPKNPNAKDPARVSTQAKP